MTGDPVSWLMIEPGWKVTDVGGNDVGRVVEVTGDTELDIFDGLVVGTGLLGKTIHVPAEEVAEITEDEIRLALGRDELHEAGS